MAQIISVLPSTGPAVPAATPVGAAATAPVTLLQPDETSPNFLSQFKAAVKSIAGGAARPSVPTRPAPDDQAGPLMSAIDDVPEGPPAAESDKHTDSMSELLAQLGFGLVPPGFPTLPLGSPDAAAPDPHLGQPVPDARVGQTAGLETLGQATANSQAGLLQPQAATTSILDAGLPLERMKRTDQSTPVVTADRATVAASDGSAGALLPPAVAANQPSAPQPIFASEAPIVGLQQTAQGGSQPRGTNRDNSHARSAQDGIGPPASGMSGVQSASASDVAMAAAVATAVPANAGLVVAQVGPGEVVSQIARHADLIRLPGNRGFRIQLHPDGLGDVQVTIRYAPGGVVELHINAEHPATAVLVQAGWSELREALATQGISPDRLMMSVGGPTGAGQADLANGGRSPSDPNAFSSSQTDLGGQGGQDSQGQSRRDAQPRTAQNWSGSAEPVSPPDASSRAASTTSSRSRIDYRV